MFTEFRILQSPTGAELAVRVEEAARKPRGLVLIQHGLAEHALRYASFARDLAGIGFHTIAHDHRGHGFTRAKDGAERMFARHNGMEKLLRDAEFVCQHASQTYPGLPLVLFGHSMGGMVAANLIRRGQCEISGAAIWNCDLNPGMQERAARVILRFERMLCGSDTASLAFRRGTFDLWRKSVSPRKSNFDWLSHAREAVALYESDPLCGWTPTNSMAMDIVEMVVEGGSDQAIASWPKQLPLHLLGGTADPVTRQGQRVGLLAARLGKTGKQAVTLRLIDGARHETLNEVSQWRDQALGSLIDWLEATAP